MWAMFSKKAQALDPKNDAYDLKMAAAYFRDENYAAGEAIRNR